MVKNKTKDVSNGKGKYIKEFISILLLEIKSE
jgi:hypothetical protein